MSAFGWRHFSDVLVMLPVLKARFISSSVTFDYIVGDSNDLNKCFINEIVSVFISIDQNLEISSFLSHFCAILSRPSILLVILLNLRSIPSQLA